MTGGIGHLEVTLRLNKVTQGTFRYKQEKEGDTRPEIGTLYLTKEITAKLGHPTVIRVMVEPLEFD